MIERDSKHDNAREMAEHGSPQHTLDLRTAKCPLNFVKTRLALEKLAVGDILEIHIRTDSESAINIPQSIAQEGHTVIRTEEIDPGVQRLWIEKRH